MSSEQRMIEICLKAYHMHSGADNTTSITLRASFPLATYGSVPRQGEKVNVYPAQVNDRFILEVTEPPVYLGNGVVRLIIKVLFDGDPAKESFNALVEDLRIAGYEAIDN